ncbi:MAG: right-handed parallel beta-helix repeat-containing protein [Flavobacteriia bacterium]|nr:right-handed parallel beta-helix repeat-containing protein [Flavobacteriia bacterium]
MNKKNILYLLLFIQLFFFISCKKEKFNSSNNLQFSIDTLVFDTVFTTIGSTTQHFKVFNPDKKGVKIDEIELMGGSTSPFRINVDGVKGLLHQNLELEGEDSLYVFVEVKLQVNGQNLPMIVEDSIRFKTNGKNQYIKLAVWGQDAYFHYNEILSPQTNDTTWSADKPHVIYNYCAIDSAKTLHIAAGSNIHLHKNSMLYVYKGSLHVEGNKDQIVTFQGDRLEEFYDDVSGQWYGIYFHQAKSSTIQYALIKNGTAGIHLYGADSNNSTFTLHIQNTIIEKHASYGVFMFDGASVKMDNSIISNCGTYGFFLLKRGDFDINHCHILGYENNTSQSYAFAIKNHFVENQTNFVGDITLGKVYNTVIYGYEEDEIAFDTLNPEAQLELNFDFSYCVIKKKESSTSPLFNQIYWNNNPEFNDVENRDFTFLNTSILQQKGIQTTLDIDLLGNPRNNPPDIGAYELE